MKGFNFTKVSAEDLTELRSSLPERGIKLSIETLVVRETIEKMKDGEGYKIEIIDWEDYTDIKGVHKKKSKIYDRIMSQMKWYNDSQNRSRVLLYLNTNRNILTIEKIPVEKYKSFTNGRNGRFSVINYRLGKSV